MSAAALRNAQDAARSLRADNRSLRAENAALRAENAALRAENAALRAAPAAGGPPAVPALAGASNPAARAPVSAGVAHAAPADLTVRAVPADLAEDAAPADRAARAAPAAPCLPVEVWVRVCAFLDKPRDIFSLACTCRSAYKASCSRGAWLEVDLDSARYTRSQTQDALSLVVDLTDDAGPSLSYAWCPSNAAVKFMMFFVAHPAAASSITRLVLPSDSERCLEPAAVMLRHCASLKRLLNLKKWGHAEGLALLRVAADARLPLEHVHLNKVTPETVPLLLRLPALSSLYFSYNQHQAGIHFEPPLDVPLLETLVKRLRLTLLELVVCVDARTPMVIESATLKELRWNGKNLTPVDMLCPELTKFELDGYVCVQTSLEARQRIMTGCPQLHAIGFGGRYDQDRLHEDTGEDVWGDYAIDSPE
jgi:hypothetical protein